MWFGGSWEALASAPGRKPATAHEFSLVSSKEALHGGNVKAIPLALRETDWPQSHGSGGCWWRSVPFACLAEDGCRSPA